MASNQDALNNKLKNIASGEQETPKPKVDTVSKLIKDMEESILSVLPKHITAERMCRLLMSAIRTTPKLLECDAATLAGAIMQAAQLGLEPNTPLGQGWLLPYWSGKRKRYEAQFIVGYRGMVDLAWRAGNVESINAMEVYSNDYLNVTYGLEEKLEHTPWDLRKDMDFVEEGQFTGAYVVVTLKGGGKQAQFMSKKKIDQVMKKTSSKNKDGDIVGPWITDYEEMAKKTVFRRMFKWLPISSEIRHHVEVADGKIAALDMSTGDISYIDPDGVETTIESKVIENDIPSNIDPTTGEIKQETLV